MLLQAARLKPSRRPRLRAARRRGSVQHGEGLGTRGQELPPRGTVHCRSLQTFAGHLRRRSHSLALATCSMIHDSRRHGCPHTSASTNAVRWEETTLRFLDENMQKYYIQLLNCFSGKINTQVLRGLRSATTVTTLVTLNPSSVSNPEAEYFQTARRLKLAPCRSHISRCFCVECRGAEGQLQKELHRSRQICRCRKHSDLIEASASIRPR